MKFTANLNHIRFAAITLCMAAMSAICARTQPTDPISLPLNTVEGTLPNGLSYLILPNGFPVGRTEFRLVWKVGAVQQDDHQGGGAHFLEHIAFGGSDNFPNRGAVAYLESLGMKYGIDINAYTGHDRTIYMFATPSDSLRHTGYSKPLSIIRDWADRLTINPQRVETEKGIILEELRSSFQEDPFYDLKIGQNRFSARMPLGTPDEVKAMTAKTLEDYYRKWYVPQLATVIVVGDVDPSSVEQEIIHQFSTLPAKPDPGFRTYSLDYSPSRQIMFDLDSLTARDELEIIIPHPTVVTRTLEDARRQEVGRILVNALSARLSDRGIKSDVSDNWYLGNTNHLVLTVREDDSRGTLESSVTALASEIKSALDHGFSPEEISYHAEKAARHIARMSHAGYTSAMWCDDLTDYVISGDRTITDATQREALKNLVATTTASEVSAMLSEWMSHMDSTLLLAVRSTPAKAKSHSIESITQAWQDGYSSPAPAYDFSAPEVTEAAKIATPAILAETHGISPGMIASTRDYASLGIREYTLSNGIRLITRPTVDDGPVMFAMVAPGGYSAIDPKKLPLLGGAASYIDMGGIAKVPAETLGDYMYQNDISLATALENHWHGFLGAFEDSHQGEFFNLVYEKITDPELRHDDFEEVRQSMIEEIGHESVLSKMLSRASDRQLLACMDRLMCNTLDTEAAYADAPDRDEAQRSFIRQMNLDSIAAFYTTLYSNPVGNVCIATGNFDADSLAADFAAVFSRFTPMERASGVTPELNLPTAVEVRQFPNENESQTEFDYVYFGRFEPGLRNSLVLKIMSNLMRNRVISELRERHALVYSPYVSLNYEGLPRGYFYYDINSSTENANMRKVHEVLAQVIRSLRSASPDPAELDAIKRSCIIAKRETLTPYAPSAWRTTLLSLIKNGESIEDFNEYESIIGSITPDEIQQAFNQLINPDLYLLLYMSDQQFQP